MLVIVATTTMAGLEGFTKGLMDSGAEVAHARSGMAALEMARVRAPVLVVVDGALADFRPAELVSELARVNAVINTAVMSMLPPDQFHDALEGLGVLAQIPSHPGEADARAVMGRLRAVLSASDNSQPRAGARDKA